MNPLQKKDWKAKLQDAQLLAQTAENEKFLVFCRQIIDDHSSDVEALLSTGGLLFNFGFHTDADRCFQRVCRMAPDDLRPLVNIASLARESGNHAESHRLYSLLLERLPDNPVIRRNALISLEYNFEVADSERQKKAKLWGEWAVKQAGGFRSRPPLAPLHNRPLKVGYLSADLCQHTVGLLVKDVISSHDSDRVVAYAYSAGKVTDWVSKKLQNHCHFQDVSQKNDRELSDIICNDSIDVLVDLSGHTAGSRLTVFAHRPAPVLVSWLGYFATTGLPFIDGVLLDKWHAPEWMDGQFVEPIVRLPGGRLCYTPVPFAPEVDSLPAKTQKHITFGSFNNTSKYNNGVYQLWAQILQQVKNSRLILKWKSLIDDGLRSAILNKFTEHGIAPDRIELRAASFHVDLLKEYGDIDIALDPFPFTGGLTSLEALWMGVPVITWPQSRVVSRQTFAVLSALGMPELVASDGDSYIKIAVDLAGNTEHLDTLRAGLREKMKCSSLCDVKGFTQSFEDTLIGLAENIHESAG